MKLKNEIYRILLSIFCCVSLTGYAIAAQDHFQDETYYRSGKKLTLSRTGAFENTDFELSSLGAGFWRTSNDTLYLSESFVKVDNALFDNAFFITYHSDNKLTLTGGNGRYSYHDYASAFKQPGFPFSSIFRGVLGMFFSIRRGVCFEQKQKRNQLESSDKRVYSSACFGNFHSQGSFC
jgi:hypothetical protein